MDDREVEAAHAELEAAKAAWLELGRRMSRTPIPPIWQWRELNMGDFFRQRAAAHQAALKRLQQAEAAVLRLTSSTAGA